MRHSKTFIFIFNWGLFNEGVTAAELSVPKRSQATAVRGGGGAGYLQSKTHTV